jgi:hypothetical protein
VLREVDHLEKIVGRAVGALPDFYRDEEIGGQLIRRSGGIGDRDLQRRVGLRYGGYDE